MMLVDTSAWIEWLTGSHLAVDIRRRLPDRSDWLVPTIVQLELAKWLTREVGDEAADRVIAFTQSCIVVPLDTRLALAAADIGRAHRLATADAIVYATALAYDSETLTCDAHFEHLQWVTFLSKTGA